MSKRKSQHDVRMHTPAFSQGLSSPGFVPRVARLLFRSIEMNSVKVMSLSPSDSVGYVQGSVARGWYMAARKRKDLWRMRLSKKLTGHDGPHYT